MILAQLVSNANPFFWYLTRDLALAAYVSLTLTVLFGLAISLARVTGERLQWPIQDLHATFATFTGVLLLGHMLTLMLDAYLPFSLRNLLVPLQQPTHTIPVDFGVLSFYGLLVLLVSSWLRKHVPYAAWRTIHYLSFATFCTVTIHGWLTGSDATATWMQGIYLGSALAVGSLVAARLFLSPQPQKGHPPKMIPVSLLVALFMGGIGMGLMLLLHTF